MKKMMMVLSMLISVSAQAKVPDFNSMIEENMAAQKQLHTEVTAQSRDVRMALNPSQAPSNILVGAAGDDVNVPTNKNFMRFKKETVRHQAEQKDVDARLASEFKSVDMSF